MHLLKKKSFFLNFLMLVKNIYLDGKCFRVAFQIKPLRNPYINELLRKWVPKTFRKVNVKNLKVEEHLIVRLELKILNMDCFLFHVKWHDVK